MPILSAFIAGLVFGLGLLVSGMSNPAKVLGFLDLGGHWDPSLAFVMVGAIAVATVGFALARRRARSWLDQTLDWPTARGVDRRLVLGGLVFGIGWGLAGFCPGPAIVALGQGREQALIFVASMLVGMGLFEWWERRR